MTRSQLLVLGFLVFAWLSLVGLALFAPQAYDDALHLPADARVLSLLGFSIFIAVVALGVVRRWRWLFWLLTIANLAGALRALASTLELMGWLPLTGPTWYVAFQGLIGIVQLAIGAVMLQEYRRTGPWGVTRQTPPMRYHL